MLQLLLRSTFYIIGTSSPLLVMILFGSYSIFYEEDAWNEMRILLYTEHSMVFVSLHKHPTKLK